MGLPERQSLCRETATVVNLREAVEYECAQIPRELLHDVSDSVAWRCQQYLDQIGVSLKTGSEENNKLSFVNIFTLLK